MPNGTEFVFTAGGKGAIRAPVLLVPLIAKPQPPLETVAAVDHWTDNAVSELLAAQAVRDDVGQMAHTARGGACRRVVVVSLGDVAKLGPPEIRRAADGAARWLSKERIQEATLWLDGLLAAGVEEGASEWVLGMVLAGFRFTEYRQSDEPAPQRITIELRASESSAASQALAGTRKAVMLGEAVNAARALAHQPGNEINPEAFADAARAFVRNRPVRCHVLRVPELRRLKMNGLLTVGQGSQHPPCLVQLEYRGAPRTRVRTVLAGKAITFDTGGYSIKPAAGLEALKFDKCGGAAVLGTFRAAADLKLKCNLFGVIPVAENAISGSAYRPGDILRLMSGKTVEVISTDAEGRLTLADALWYAQRKLKPTTLIDLATLTGGVTVALGSAAAGLMSNDDALAEDLAEAGRRTNERLWRLPLWEDYRELIKGQEADVRNASGKREAHAIAGGMFLQEFIDPGQPWAHLDIAGVATRDNDRPGAAKGATGFGVRLLIEFLKLRGAESRGEHRPLAGARI